jgi:hypothetical protein
MASARPIRITPVTWRASLAADNLDTPAGGALPGAGSVRAPHTPRRRRGLEDLIAARNLG